MSEIPTESLVPDTHFEEAVALFLRQREEGSNPDPEQFLQRFPDLTEQLQEFFDGLALFRNLAPDLAPLRRRRDGAPSAEPSACQRVAGFEMLGELGRGGMGVVYRARQQKLDRVVALKMLRSGNWASDQERLRFAAEARAVARLQHPNIVQVFEVGEHESLPFLVLELVEGGSLAERCRGEPWEPRRAAALVEKLARTISHAHSHGIIHRDLKPANVLLTPDGEPKITDFGLAKRTDAGEGLSRTSVLLGTPSYMAPEQAAGKPHEVGPAADLWALGVVLYELLAGRPPFRAASVLDTLSQVRSDDPVPPSQLVGRLPRDLETICLKCLRKEPVKRYGSMEKLADDLAAFLRGEPIQARPVGRPERLWRWCRRNPAVAGLLALSAGLLLTGTGVSVGFALDADSKRDEADYQRNQAIGSAAAVRGQRDEAERQRKSAEGLAEKLASSLKDLRKEKDEVRKQLDRSEFVNYSFQLRDAQDKLARGRVGEAEMILRACDPKLCHWEHVYLLSRSLRLLLSIEGNKRGIPCLAFSPDGTRFAVGDFDGMVQVWDAWTGRPIFAVKGHIGKVKCLVFSPDGKTLASGSYDRTIKLWDVRTFKWWDTSTSGKGGVIPPLLLTFKGFQHDVCGVTFSSDGMRFASADGNGNVKICDSQTGEEILSVKGGGWQVAFSPDGTLLASGSSYVKKVWDARTGKEQTGKDNLFRLDPPHQPCTSDGKLRASGFLGTVQLSDVRTGKEVLTLLAHPGVTAIPLAFSADGNRLATWGGYDCKLKVWDVRTGEDMLILDGHERSIQSVAFGPDSTRLASVGMDDLVKVWDVRASKELLSVRSPNLWNRNVVFSPDGTRLATACMDRTVQVREAETGREVFTLKGHTGYANGVSFSPDGQRLASASEDWTVKLWDIRTGKELFTCRGHKNSVTSVAFSPNGQTIVSGSLDMTVKLWDARTGKELLTCRGHTNGVSSVAFSLDGQTLASGGYDMTVKLWEAGIGKERASLKGHTTGVFSVAFSPDSTRLASAGHDGMVKVWDVQTGQEAITLKGGTLLFSSVAFSPDGTFLAAGSSADNKVSIWRADRVPLR